MKLVVGLGNPGKEYERTRHNVGWRVLDAMATVMPLSFSFEKKFNAEVAKVGDVLFCKPQTFMNLSGQAVRAMMDYYKMTPNDVVLVYDDKDLPLGTIRVRSTGSSGGHNGVQSVIEHLGTQDVARIRIGIASDHPMNDTADFVLAPFSRADEEVLKELLPKAQELIQEYISHPAGALTHQDVALDK